MQMYGIITAPFLGWQSPAAQYILIGKKMVVVHLSPSAKDPWLSRGGWEIPLVLLQLPSFSPLSPTFLSRIVFWSMELSGDVYLPTISNMHDPAVSWNTFLGMGSGVEFDASNRAPRKMLKVLRHLTLFSQVPHPSTLPGHNHDYHQWVSADGPNVRNYF